jgi:hypothetical protein
MMVTNQAGWWLSPTPLKNDGVKVSWNDDSQLNGKIKNVPNHQPASIWRFPKSLGWVKLPMKLPYDWREFNSGVVIVI